MSAILSKHILLKKIYFLCHTPSELNFKVLTVQLSTWHLTKMQRWTPSTTSKTQGWQKGKKLHINKRQSVAITVIDKRFMYVELTGRSAKEPNSLTKMSLSISGSEIIMHGLLPKVSMEYTWPYFLQYSSICWCTNPLCFTVSHKWPINGNGMGPLG